MENIKSRQPSINHKKGKPTKSQEETFQLKELSPEWEKFYRSVMAEVAKPH